MRHWIKKFVRFVLLLAVMAVIITSLQVVVLPLIARHLILRRLADIGLSEATLEVRSCSLRSAELTDVASGNEHCASIGALTAEYSLNSLFGGRVNKVMVTGGELLLRIRDGRIELGELANIAFKGGRQSAEAPFDSIELRACTLSIDWPQKRICIPCEGSIRNNGAGWIVHDLRLNFQGTPLQLKATLYTRGESLVFSLYKQDIDLQALMTALPVKGFSVPSRLAGTIGLKLQGEILTSGTGASLKAFVSDTWFKTAVAGAGLDVEGINGELKVELENLSQLKSIAGKLSAETVQFAGVPVSNVHLDLEKVSDKLVLSGEAQGEEWQLKSFSAALPAVWSTDNIQRNLADVAWEFEGNLPGPISRKFAAHGLDISGLGTMNLSGRLSTTLSQEPDLDLTSLQVALSPGTLNIDKGRLAMQGLSGILNLQGHYSQKEALLRLLPDSTLNLDSARFESITFGKTSFDLKAANEHNTVKWTFGENGPATRVNLEASADSTKIRSAKNVIMANLSGIRLLLDTGLSPDFDDANGMLTIDTFSFYPGYRGLSLDLQNAMLNVDSKLDDDEKAVVKTTLTLDRAALLNQESEVLFAADKSEIKPVSGSFDVMNLSGDFQSEWSIQNGAILNIKGNLDLNEERPSGSLRVVCEGLHLDAEQAAVKMLAGSTDIVTTGDLSAEADLHWSRGHFTPRIKIAIADGSFSSTLYETKAEGIAGLITLTNLFPIATPGNQILTIKSLKLGRAEFTNGLVAFRLETDPAAAFIESTEWEWMGGHLYTHAVRIDPNLPRVDFRLFAERLVLRELLDTVFGKGTTGQGELNGMIPVSISLSSLADLKLGEGFLYSPSRAGWWKLAEDTPQNPAWKAVERQLRWASEAAARTSGTGLLSKGLLDFEYSRFKIDFVAEQNGLTARIVTQGRSRNRKIPVEFEQITMNIPGFDEILRQMIAIKSAINLKMKREIEKVE